MNPVIKEFLNYIESREFVDYGDFKREVDLHLRQMSESLRPLSVEQSWQLRKLREQLLWMYNNNVDEVRSYLHRELTHLGDNLYTAESRDRKGVEL